MRMSICDVNGQSSVFRVTVHPLIDFLHCRRTLYLDVSRYHHYERERRPLLDVNDDHEARKFSCRKTIFKMKIVWQ